MPSFTTSAAALAAALALTFSASAQAQPYAYQSTLGTPGATGSDNAHFNDPIGGAVDPIHNRVFISDVLNQRVQIFDAGTLAYVGTLGTSGAAGSDNAHFSYPSAVGFDAATGHIFVPDYNNHRVQIFDAGTLAYVRTLGTSGAAGSDNAHFNGPVSARLVDKTHQLLVTDYNNQRVQIFDAGTLAYVGTLGTSGAAGSDNAHFNGLEDAEYNPKTNQIMVADQNNARVQIFDAGTLAYVQTLGGPGADSQHFSAPVTAAFDPTTNLVLVSDGGSNDRVQIFDAVNYQYVATLGTTGSPGQANSQFFGPFGIGIDTTHKRIIIGDSENQRVQVFSTSPSALHASVLPGSRSVQLGKPATIYATVINAGPSQLDNCSISLPTTAPAGLSLSYQTTNPATNALTGTANQPVSIASNDGLQTFLITFQGSAAFSAPGMPLDFSCDGSAPADVITGVDTVDLTMSVAPIADIIALSATASGNGVVTVPQGAAGAFAVASTNLGVTDQITVSVDTGSAALPVTATICQSNPASGSCLSAPAPTVALAYAAGSTPTFSVFLQSSGAITFDPANSRIFVRFKDAAGELHGSTSVAIETM